MNIIQVGFKRKTKERKNIVEVEYLGKKQDALLMMPYGLHANPENDIFAVIMAPEDNQDSIITIPADIDSYEDLEGGEIAIGVPALEARMFYTKEDKIVFRIGKKKGGDNAVRFAELKSGFDELKQDVNNLVTAYNSHTHVVTTSITVNGITPGPSSASGTGTGTAVVTTSTGSPTAASIDTSKIDEIEVPPA